VASKTRKIQASDKRGGYSGTSSAATMKPPAKVPSAAMKQKSSKK
jgi:hypothetical protein